VRGRLQQNGVSISLFERMLLRFGLVDRLKIQTLELRNRIAPILGSAVPRWGRGRVDTFNPYKAIQFNWPIDRLPHDELIGASDFPSLWNQRPREGLHLHWDGDNDSVDERNLSAALGAGVTPVTVDHASIKRVRDWIWTLPPPAYPYPIDATRASHGAMLYRQYCVTCHATTSSATVSALPRRRASGSSKTSTASDRSTSPRFLYRCVRGQSVRALSGVAVPVHAFPQDARYANHPLDGIWARAPYLHNGSVPTLLDLLNAAAERPAVFYRAMTYSIANASGSFRT
jgi:hypothetical protein